MSSATSMASFRTASGGIGNLLALSRHYGRHCGGVAGFDAYVDNSDCAVLDGGNGLLECWLKVGNGVYRTEAVCALRARHGCKIDIGLGNALTDPTVLHGAIAHAGHSFLMQFVVEERAVIGDHDQERNAVMCRRPQGGDPHQEIAIAADCNRQPVAASQCQRCANRNARTATDAAAAIRAEIVKRMIEGPAGTVPGQRYVRQRCRAIADRAPKCIGQMVDGELVICKFGEFLFVRGRSLRTLRTQRSEKGRYCNVRFAIEEHIDRGKSLIVHTPAIMKIMVD